MVTSTASPWSHCDLPVHWLQVPELEEQSPEQKSSSRRLSLTFAPHVTESTSLFNTVSSFTAALPEKTHYSHFPDEETEAQRGELPVLGYKLKPGLLTQNPALMCPPQIMSHDAHRHLLGGPSTLARTSLPHVAGCIPAQKICTSSLSASMRGSYFHLTDLSLAM